MIVVRVEGGLGNQMFQVAFGMQLAWRHRTELVLDLSAYAGKPEHGYLLHRFRIDARELRLDERRRLPRRYRDATIAGRPWEASSLLARNRLQRVREKPFGFADKYLSTSDGSYLVGYWQSEKFFRDVRDQVREQFSPRGPLSRQSESLRERMLGTPSVAMHIRRGDYVHNSSAAAIYRNLSVEHYRRCIADYLAVRPQAEAVVFSNDIAWCREQLKALPCPVHFVEHTSPATAHEDLWMMTAAECQIIANSTFSWWGAWLCQHARQRVYAPRSWFHPGTLDDRHLACQSWILVDDPAPQIMAA